MVSSHVRHFHSNSESTFKYVIQSNLMNLVYFFFLNISFTQTKPSTKREISDTKAKALWRATYLSKNVYTDRRFPLLICAMFNFRYRVSFDVCVTNCNKWQFLLRTLLFYFLREWADVMSISDRNKNDTYAVIRCTKFTWKAGNVSVRWCNGSDWFLLDLKQLRFQHLLLTIFLLSHLSTNVFVSRSRWRVDPFLCRFTGVGAPKFIGTRLKSVNHFGGTTIKRKRKKRVKNLTIIQWRIGIFKYCTANKIGHFNLCVAWEPMQNGN